MTAGVVTTKAIVLTCRWCGREVARAWGEVEAIRGTCPFRDCKLVSEFVIAIDVNSATMR